MRLILRSQQACSKRLYMSLALLPVSHLLSTVNLFLPSSRNSYQTCQKLVRRLPELNTEKTKPLLRYSLSHSFLYVQWHVLACLGLLTRFRIKHEAESAGVQVLIWSYYLQGLNTSRESDLVLNHGFFPIATSRDDSKRCATSALEERKPRDADESAISAVALWSRNVSLPTDYCPINRPQQA